MYSNIPFKKEYLFLECHLTPKRNYALIKCVVDIFSFFYSEDGPANVVLTHSTTLQTYQVVDFKKLFPDYNSLITSRLN